MQPTKYKCPPLNLINILLLHHPLLCASFIAFHAFWTNTYSCYLNNKWENWKLENSLASNTEWKESATRRSKERRFECWNSNCWRCWCPLWFGPSLSVTLKKTFKIMKLKSAFSSLNVGPSNGGSFTFTWAPSTTGCSSSNGFVSFWKLFLDLKLAAIQDQWWKIVILEQWSLITIFPHWSWISDPRSMILDQWPVPTWKWRTTCSMTRMSRKPVTTMKGTTGKSVVVPYFVFTSSKTWRQLNRN